MITLTAPEQWRSHPANIMEGMLLDITSIMDDINFHIKV